MDAGEIEKIIDVHQITLAMVDGKEMLRIPIQHKPSEANLLIIRNHRDEIISFIKDKAAREAAEKAKKILDIKSGATPITLRYQEGEYLSGYPVFGDQADLLVSAGAAHYVSGWGYIVNDFIIKNLGTEFTFPQVIELTNPQREAKAAAEAAAKAERDEKFRLARETGEKVLLRHYTDDCNDPREECSLDNVYEYAMPDGSIKTVRNHTW